MPLSPRKYSGAVYCAVPSRSVRAMGVVDLHDAGHAGRAEIDDLHRAVAVDHDVFRPQVLVQHLLAVEREQSPRDLFDDAAHRFQVRFRVVYHPLRQGLAVDVFGGDIEVVALACQLARLEHMRAS